MLAAQAAMLTGMGQPGNALAATGKRIGIVEAALIGGLAPYGRAFDILQTMPGIDAAAWFLDETGPDMNVFDSSHAASRTSRCQFPPGYKRAIATRTRTQMRLSSPPATIWPGPSA